MLDPPRTGVRESIIQCKRAGVSVIMITGDIKETAQAIAEQIGILTREQTKERSFTGQEFFDLPEARRQEILKKCVEDHGGLVFSRTEPKHKRFLVKELKELVILKLFYCRLL